MNKKKFIRVLMLAFSLVFALAIIDEKLFVPLHETIGEIWAFPSAPSTLAIGIFWALAILIGVAVCFTYYICLKDLSETIGVGLTYFLAAIAGWEDIFYYAIKGQSIIGMQLPDLKINVFINTISHFLGASVPNGNTLIASAVIGAIIILVADYFLLGIDRRKK